MPPHVRHGLRGLPPGYGWSVTDFWSWGAHEARLRCPDEVDGDIWIWSTRRTLNLNSTKYPDHGHHGNPPLSGKNPHGTAGNWTRDLMISSQKHWPLDHEAGVFTIYSHQLSISGGHLHSPQPEDKWCQSKQTQGWRIKLFKHSVPYNCIQNTTLKQ
jgi:hypothetical protein